MYPNQKKETLDKIVKVWYNTKSSIKGGNGENGIPVRL